MSFTLKYVAKKSELVGKTLWEILGNLKDFGVGRIIVRNSVATKYPEPSYMRILSVTPQPNYIEPKIKKFRPPNDLRDKMRARQEHALCELVYRGVKHDDPVEIRGESVLPDFRLVPKESESQYKWTKTTEQAVEENIYPQHIEFPPLMKEMLQKNGVKDPKLEVHMDFSAEDRIPFYRMTKGDEKPNKPIETGSGTPKSPNLLNGVNYEI